MRLDIQGLDQVQRMLRELPEKQIPFATSLGLNRLNERIKAAEIDTMQRVFDRPTKHTLNSLFLKPATKTRLETRVWFKDFAPKGTPAGDYLKPQIYGGPREPKRSEVLLRNQGILGRNQYLVPSTVAPLDAYGNINRGQIGKLLSQLRAQFDPVQNTVSPAAKKRQKRKGRQYFARRKGKGRSAQLLGIWVRTGEDIEPFLVATRQVPSYKIRFKFFEVAQATIAREAQPVFAEAIAQALRTAGSFDPNLSQAERSRLGRELWNARR